MKTTRTAMRTIVNWLYRWRIWQDLRGQDMVEYALLASLVAVASGLFLPDLRDSMEAIYSRVKSKLVEAGG
jgi:Flp pilus assembly pilin Flp